MVATLVVVAILVVFVQSFVPPRFDPLVRRRRQVLSAVRIARALRGDR